MSWKTWVVIGLASQFVAVLPPVVLYLTPKRAKADSEYGTIVGLIEKPDKKDWFWMSITAVLALFGVACQIIALTRDP